MFFESRMRWFAAGVGVGDAAASSGIGSSHSRSSGLTARRPRATLRSILNGEGGAPVALPPRHERRATLRRVAALRAPRQRPWRRRKRCCRREPTRAPQGCGASSARPRWCRQGGGRGAAGAGAARAQPADTACAPPRAAVGAPRPSPPRGARSAHLPLSGGGALRARGRCRRPVGRSHGSGRAGSERERLPTATPDCEVCEPERVRAQSLPGQSRRARGTGRVCARSRDHAHGRPGTAQSRGR